MLERGGGISGYTRSGTILVVDHIMVRPAVGVPLPPSPLTFGSLFVWLIVAGIPPPVPGFALTLDSQSVIAMPTGDSADMLIVVSVDVSYGSTPK